MSPQEPSEKLDTSDLVTLFLTGDVMIGRGIDQILSHPSDPFIHEPYLKDARRYVEIAEEVNGPIPRAVDPDYIWGDALLQLEKIRPDLRIINLETSITKSNDHWKGKEIHYRMNPDNVDCLTAAKIDVCSLANNHVLDWGYTGLKETLETLRKAGIEGVGAGMDLEEARAPFVKEVRGRGRVILFAFGSPTSGVPIEWGASEKRPGVNLLRDFSSKTIRGIRKRIEEIRQDRDIVIASIHWGGNWGFRIDEGQIRFAHQLIDEAGVDLLHGHSSHHIKGIEVYQERLVLYGCGDFLNDYEGIGGYEYYRSDLGAMYFVTMSLATRRLVRVEIVPTRTVRFRINLASEDDVLWLTDILNREGRRFRTTVSSDEDRILTLHWNPPS